MDTFLLTAEDRTSVCPAVCPLLLPPTQAHAESTSLFQMRLAGGISPAL